MKNFNCKIILLIIFIFTLLHLSGCFKISINGEIDSDYLATYRGDIELNLSKQESSQKSLAQQSLLKLSEYWKSIGYESQVSLDNDTYYIYFKKQKQCENYEEAFDELFKMMTDEYSPFSELNYVYAPYTYYIEYEVDGSIDITNVLDSQVYESMQKEIKDAINSEMNNLDATVDFTLPNQENFSQSSSSSKTFSFPIKTDEVTEFSLNGRINKPDIADGNIELVEKYNYYHTLVYILLALLIILVILLLMLLTKKTKN